jgi:penicillin G amidase
MFSTVLIAGAIILGSAAILVGGFYFYLYWWLVQRPTPVLEGVQHVTGLQDEVEILRDQHGIPHIYAKERADLFRAQGYVHAQDRMWQMEQQRRIAFGTMSALFGEATLDLDRFCRIVGIGRAAEAELAQIDDDSFQVLQWYAEGVNSYLTANPGKVAAEINLLRFSPQPWQPVDTLAILKLMAWIGSTNWESELTRLQLFGTLGSIRAADLEPDFPAENPVLMESAGEGEITRLLSTSGLLLNEYEKLRQWLGHVEAGQGSNSWVVAPKHSLTRRALLANDPHTAVQIPALWYENHLEGPGFSVSGASYAGAPGVVLGHNEQIAWGMSSAYVDVQDLYLEEQHPEHHHLFRLDDDWEEATVLQEEIAVRRWERPHVEEIVVTRNGPLISQFVSNRDPDTIPMALSLRWTGHGSGGTLRALLRLNQAANWEEFQVALADWAGAPQNITYADSRGNVGYLLAGSIPVRDQHLGLAPGPGWDARYRWAEMIPPHNLPRIYNPDSGKIVAANQKIVGDEYPYFMGAEYMPGWRAARLLEMLEAKDRHSLRDMEQMQLDTSSKFAAQLAPWFAQIEASNSWDSVAISKLRKWNYRMEVDDPAALVFTYALVNLLEMTYGDKLGANKRPYLAISRSPLFTLSGMQLRAGSRLLELIREHEESAWYMDMKSGKSRSREEILAAALSQAVRQIREQLGDNAQRWNWGRVHQIRYIHPLGSVRFFRQIFNRGPVPVGGDATTPHQTSAGLMQPDALVQVCATYRQIFEVGEWDRSQSVIATGQSGHPLSRLYDDQITLWRENVYHKMPWSRNAVEEATQYRQWLRPHV